MELNFPQQPNLSSSTDAKVGFLSILDKIKVLFVNPLTVTIIILTFAMGYFFEWWTVAIAAFIGGAVFGKSSGETFTRGMFAVILLWLVMVCYQHNAYFFN